MKTKKQIQDAAPAPPAAEAPAAPQTRVRFDRGVYKPGIERLRVVRRENTVGPVAGQVALNVAFAVLAADLALNPAVAARTEALAATPEKRW